jgi:DNA repair exonuclease SbcCD ATPase subunit
MRQELIERVRLYEQDHAPDGWPAIKMHDVSALADAIEALQKEVNALDIALEECKMDWSGDVAQIKAEHKHEIAELQAENDEQKVVMRGCNAALAAAKLALDQASQRHLEIEAERDTLAAKLVPDVDWLANVIRQVDGNHKLGAGALAEKIVEAIAAHGIQAKGGQHEDA